MIKGVLRGGQYTPTEDALREAALYGHLDGWPLLVVAAALRDWPKKRPSASAIASVSWRQQVLTAILDYYVRIEERYPLIRGSLVHSGFESFQAPEGVKLIREKRMRIVVPKLEDIVLSGQIDLYYPEHRRIEDYKTCSSVPEYIKPNHMVQLAVYAWLLRWSGFEVEDAAINYVAWHECKHTQHVKNIDGSVVAARTHALMTSEGTFLQHILDAWEVMLAGFQDNVVPSTQECDLRYCYRCPVKWACDQIDMRGETIIPDQFRQEDF